MSRVVIHDAVLNRMLRSRQGPVGQIILQKSSVILGHARTNIQTNLTSRSGDLEAALRRIPIEDDSGFHVAVGSDATHRGYGYAYALETGKNPLTGEDTVHRAFPFMVPAVQQAGFRLRKA